MPFGFTKGFTFEQCFPYHFIKPYLNIYWTARRSNQSILKKINPTYPLEGLMLKLKLKYFGHLMQRTDTEKDPDAGKD